MCCGDGVEGFEQAFEPCGVSSITENTGFQTVFTATEALTVFVSQ